jgi:DUF4097 and DUF4098 domain-containing protein YvlB
MRAKLLIFALAFVFCLLWLTVQTGAAFSRARLEKESHQTFSLTSTGQVKLDNLNGIVRISTWDRAEVQVDAVKIAETEAELEEVKIEIDSKPEHIRIHTKYPTTKWSLWKRNNSTTVEYDLKVPVHAVLEHIENVNGRIEIEGVQGRVHASTVNGKMSLNGLAADADLDSVNGSILVMFDNLEAVHRASLKTVNGRVSLTLPPDGNAELSAHTLNGRISSGLDVAPTKHWPIGSDLHGTLGTGGTQIHAETVNGAIQFRRGEADKIARQSELQAAGPKPEREE